MRKLVILAAMVAAVVGLVAPQAAAAKPMPSCSIAVAGDGTAAVTFTASFTDVPKNGTVTFAVDGVATASPATVTSEGAHSAAASIVQKGKGTIATCSATGTVVVPPAPVCTVELDPNDPIYVLSTVTGISGPWFVSLTTSLGENYVTRDTEGDFTSINDASGDPKTITLAAYTSNPADGGTLICSDSYDWAPPA
jgi:hypothetical protein